MHKQQFNGVRINILKFTCRLTSLSFFIGLDANDLSVDMLNSMVALMNAPHMLNCIP